jgi:membrane protein YdbS with pleckstrin-like domain
MSGTIATIRPHSSYLAKLYVSTLLVFLLFIFPFVFLGLVPELGWTYVLIFLGANLLWIAPTFALYPAYVRSIYYELKEDEIVVHNGIITHSTKVVPYRTVTNLHLKRDLLDRYLFKLGTLNVQTAGMSGQTGAEEVLVGLEDYEGVLLVVREELRRYRSTMATMTEIEAPAGAQPVVLLSDELLQEVREIKALLKKSAE